MDKLKKRISNLVGKQEYYGYWVSKDWLTEWKTKKEEELVDYMINKDITCQHGNLSPDSSLRRIIGSEAWDYFKMHFKIENSFPHDSPVCPSCKQEIEQKQRLLDQLKTIRQREKDKLRFTPKPLKEIKYSYNYHWQYIIPLWWYLNWQKYVFDTTVDQPTHINTEAFLCIHGGLICDLNESFYFPVLVVSSQEYDSIRSLGYDINFPIKVQYQSGSIHTDPATCIECKNGYLATLDSFPLPKQFRLNVHGNYSKYEIEVEDDNDIAFVKLKICERTGIPPNQQELSYRGRTLNEEEIIKLIRIYPGEILELKKVNPPASPQIRRRIVEEDSIMVDIDQISKQEREIAGFQGTLLHSSSENVNIPQDAANEVKEWECNYCGLINTPFVTQCAACANDKSSEDGWRCKTCTLINSLDQSICAACDTPQG